MSIPGEAFRAFQRKKTENPRTILGFYATVLALLLAACVGGATTILVTKTGLEYLPGVFIFGGAVFVLIVGGVFWISIKDPSKLMLGRITGEEYAEIQRVALGDSSSGEHLTPLLVVEQLPVAVEMEATVIAQSQEEL